MENIKNIKDALSKIGPSKKYTAICEDGNLYEFFKLDTDGYYYVLNTNTNRATRYNGEIQNGKRIGMSDYIEANDKLEAEAAQKELNEATEYYGMSEDRLYTAAEDPEVSLEEFKAMIKEAEESATTEQIEEINKELAPKTKKVRKPKDIGLECDVKGTHVVLTSKQVDFIRHLPDTCFWENGLDSCIWVDCLCDDIGGQFTNKPMTVGAMISTLCEKRLGSRAKQRVNGKKCTSFALTELGKIVATEVGLC